MGMPRRKNTEIKSKIQRSRSDEGPDLLTRDGEEDEGDRSRHVRSKESKRRTARRRLSADADFCGRGSKDIMLSPNRGEKSAGYIKGFLGKSSPVETSSVSSN